MAFSEKKFIWFQFYKFLLQNVSISKYLLLKWEYYISVLLTISIVCNLAFVFGMESLQVKVYINVYKKWINCLCLQ